MPDGPASGLSAINHQSGGPLEDRGTDFPGLALGSELGWANKIGGPEPTTRGRTISNIVFKNPAWDWRTFELESAGVLADQIDKGTTNAIDPDLSAFSRRGGKLLLYHGWADQNFSALSTLNYYRSVLDKMGSVQTRQWLRLILGAGYGTLGGGEGPNSFDAVAAIERWIENGEAPRQIIASHRTDGRVDWT